MTGRFCSSCFSISICCFLLFVVFFFPSYTSTRSNVYVSSQLARIRRVLCARQIQDSKRVRRGTPFESIDVTAITKDIVDEVGGFCSQRKADEECHFVTSLDLVKRPVNSDEKHKVRREFTRTYRLNPPRLLARTVSECECNPQ